MLTSHHQADAGEAAPAMPAGSAVVEVEPLTINDVWAVCEGLSHGLSPAPAECNRPECQCGTSIVFGGIEPPHSGEGKEKEEEPKIPVVLLILSDLR